MTIWSETFLTPNFYGSLVTKIQFSTIGNTKYQCTFCLVNPLLGEVNDLHIGFKKTLLIYLAFGVRKNHKGSLSPIWPIKKLLELRLASNKLASPNVSFTTSGVAKIRVSCNLVVIYLLACV